MVIDYGIPENLWELPIGETITLDKIQYILTSKETKTRLFSPMIKIGTMLSEEWVGRAGPIQTTIEYTLEQCQGTSGSFTVQIVTNENFEIIRFDRTYYHALWTLPRL